MKSFMLLLLIGLSTNTLCQTAEPPFIKLVTPSRETTTVSATRQFIIGSTCKTCDLSINGVPVKVYNSGGFAYEINIGKTDTVFTIIATTPSKKTISKTLLYNYAPPKLEEPVSTFDITSIQTFPEGNLVLKPGDKGFEYDKRVDYSS